MVNQDLLYSRLDEFRTRLKNIIMEEQNLVSQEIASAPDHDTKQTLFSYLQLLKIKYKMI